MPINIGKNLKIEPTNDTKVSKFVRSYKQVHDYIENQYSSEESNVSLYDLLTSLLSQYSISYSNLPVNSTFVWTSGGQTLSQNNVLVQGSIVDYSLTYSDGSKSVGTFTVSDDFILDLSTLVANKFIITVTADKTLSKVRVYHNYTSGSTSYIDITSFTNNTATIECDKNENVRIFAQADGWSQVAQTPDFMNIGSCPHDYTSITQNISDTYNFAYESYIAVRVFLKDENNEYINMDSSYLNYITWNPSNSPDASYIGITYDNPEDYYNIWKDKSLAISYTINVPNYAQTSGTFAAQSTTSPNTIEQTKTLVPLVTYTVTPDPIGATVTLTAPGYTTVSGTGTQSITVGKGTEITMVISLSGYDTITDTFTLNSTTSETKQMTSSFTPETTTFNYTGAVQTYTVPQGVTKLIVDCVGAASRQVWTSSVIYSDPLTDGKGGRVQCKLTVTAGQILNIYIGGNNAYNGGGIIYNNGNTWSCGGGASDIRIGGTSLTDRKVVAGGGGGGYRMTGTGSDGNVYGGSGGGLTGGDGGNGPFGSTGGGKGGTQSAGGAAGGSNGVAGTLGQGGGQPGGYNQSVNLAGGGGYYGGGSSTQDGYFTGGGGGGGSSYTDPTLCTDVIHTQGYSEATGNGWIIITTSNE